MSTSDTKLIEVEEIDTCLSCFEETKNRVTCCKATICNNCYFEWLKHKRQCMHCKTDQCDFDTWMEKYRVEQEPEPEDFGDPAITLQAFIQGLNETAQAGLLYDVIPLPNESPPAFDSPEGFNITPSGLYYTSFNIPAQEGGINGLFDILATILPSQQEQQNSDIQE